MHRLVYVEAALNLAPAICKRLVEQVAPANYDERLSNDRFTLREVMAHLADLEPVIRGRMELAVREPGAEVPNFDQDAEAVAKRYETWDVGESVQKYIDERAKTLALFQSLDEAEMRRTVKHPKLGEVSVLDLTMFVMGHDTYHIDQISQY